MKYSAIIDTDNRKELGSRRDFELHRSDRDAWKPVSWARLKKAVKEEIGTRRPKVNLVLRAAKGNEWLDDGQDFGLDSAGALRTAKKLIQDGLADSVWINVRYGRVFAERGTASHTLFYLRRAERNPRTHASRSRPKKNPRGKKQQATFDQYGPAQELVTRLQLHAWKTGDSDITLGPHAGGWVVEWDSGVKRKASKKRSSKKKVSKRKRNPMSVRSLVARALK